MKVLAEKNVVYAVLLHWAFLDKSGQALQLGLDRTYARFNLVVLLLNAGEHHERP